MNRPLNALRIFLALLTVVTLSASGANPKAKGGNKADKPPAVDAGMLLAPLNGALNIEAGTLEARFALDYSFDDYLRPSTSYCVPFPFLQLYKSDGLPSANHIPPESFINIILAQGQGAHTIVFNNSWYYYENKLDPSIHYRSAALSGNKEKGPWFKIGEWHSLAVTWMATNQGLRVEFYIDGTFRTGTTLPKKESSVKSLGEEDYLSIGSETFSAGTLQSYRLSNRVRTKEEIASNKPLVSDEATTFFIDGGTAEKLRTLKESAFSGMKIQKKLNIKQPVFVGNIKIVSTPNGKAIQFYKTRSR